MANKSAHRCRKCQRIVRGRCEHCAAQQRQRLDKQRRSDPADQAAKRFYKSKPWRALRKLALQRDAYQCKGCGCQVAGKQAQVDHIQDRATHPELALSLDNLQTVCTSCHNRKRSGKSNNKPTAAQPQPYQLPEYC